MLDWLPDFTAWTPTDWAALGPYVTALIAVFAGAVAWRQLREARRLRREQAQPYVACFAEPTPGHDQGVDIVIRNFGTTIARDVTISISPDVMRSGGPGRPPEEVRLPTHIPALVPGQEWRTWWDLGPSRAELDLVGRHEVVVAYRDSQGKKLPPTPSVLDWEYFTQHTFLVTKGQHEMATALQELSKTVASFKYRHNGGFAAFVRNADALDQREREDMPRRMAHHRRLVAEVKQAQARWRQQREAEGAADEAPSDRQETAATTNGWWRRRGGGR
ncbi:hypothetical protein [Trujillonella endophytica]|uniref:hypothetical protein n=1 Tax=Trujillonella endophytica TaxID=673521 RepID=UPI00111382B6|nr:hypothetical protein [Trujillella endophytica]